MALPRRSPGRLETSIVRLWCHRCGSVASDCAASAASARVLLSGIGALILTRPCGPGGWQARLAVAWCAWSSGGHRVLLVAQAGSARQAEQSGHVPPQPSSSPLVRLAL